MFLSWLFASARLLGLGVGLGSVFAQARALCSLLDAYRLKRVFFADTLWGLAALIRHAPTSAPSKPPWSS